MARPIDLTTGDIRTNVSLRCKGQMVELCDKAGYRAMWQVIEQAVAELHERTFSKPTTKKRKRAKR